MHIYMVVVSATDFICGIYITSIHTCIYLYVCNMCIVHVCIHACIYVCVKEEIWLPSKNVFVTVT